MGSKNKGSGLGILQKYQESISNLKRGREVDTPQKFILKEIF